MNDGRRKAVRTPRKCKVIMQQMVCFTTDLTEGGFCVASTRVLPPGTAVEGTIEMDGEFRLFTGTVAWSKPGDRRRAEYGFGRMGIRFTAAPQAGSFQR